MFDISWSEFLLIGVVALIFIGPKELPGVLRTLGQYTRKVRSMAADFQSQFQEAMREAEMADLKKEVDAMAKDIKDFDPLKDVKSDVEAMSRDIERSLEAPAAATSSAETSSAETPGAAESAASDAVPAIEAAPATPVESDALAPASGAAKTEPAEPAAEAAPSDSMGRPA